MVWWTDVPGKPIRPPKPTGYVVVTADFFKDTTGNILAEICMGVAATVRRSSAYPPPTHLHTHKQTQTGKEYAKADSRYATRDAFVIAMEAVTAFAEGPCCFAVVYGILTRQPWRYTLMMLVSLGQIYGDVLYFATCIIEGTYCGKAGRTLPRIGVCPLHSCTPQVRCMCAQSPSITGFTLSLSMGYGLSYPPCAFYTLLGK